VAGGKSLFYPSHPRPASRGNPDSGRPLKTAKTRSSASPVVAEGGEAVGARADRVSVIEKYRREFEAKRMW